jgi:hypothetical protein
VNRDVVVALLALVLGGAGLWLSGSLPLPAGPAGGAVGGATLERRAWWRLWGPMLPAALALATLAGWALQEPGETDELLSPVVGLLALPIALVWLRAAARAVLALRRPRVAPPIATFGIVRPRIAIAAGVEHVLDPAALAAAVAHERAHARHRDPLRIWLAQLATDAQWPLPAARARLDRWMSALEIARDDDARRQGVRGEDLAAAVVAVARLPRGDAGLAIARLTGAEIALAARIRRLLAPLPRDARGRGHAAPLVLAAALGVAVVVGLEFGDSLLRALPFIRT